MKYRITEKSVYCDTRDCRVDCYGHSIFDCLECPNRAFIEDMVYTCTQEQYISLLNRGNTYITNVDVVNEKTDR